MKKRLLSFALALTVMVSLLSVMCPRTVYAESYVVKFAMPTEYITSDTVVRLYNPGATTMTKTAEDITIDGTNYTIYSLSTDTIPTKNTSYFYVYLNLPTCPAPTLTDSQTIGTGTSTDIPAPPIVGDAKIAKWYSTVDWQFGENIVAVPIDYDKMLSGSNGNFKFVDISKYTVTFDVGEHGTAPQSQNVMSGALAPQPSDPSEIGYTFGGWYKEATYENKWNFETDTVTKNTTLYAKWTAKTTPETSDITFTAPSSLTYDKTAKAATVTGKEGMGTITVRYATSLTSEEWTNEPPINAGTYYVKACITEGTQYAAANLTDAAWTFTITPAKLQVTLSQNTFVYNGKEQQPEVTVNGVEGDNLTEGTDYQVTIGQATRVNVGTYTVNVASFNANYVSADEATYTITEANVPTTGDITNMWLYIALAALALGAMGTGVVVMRKKANR